MNIKRHLSKQESSGRNNFAQLFKKCPLPDDELLSNLQLFMKRQDISRLLFFDELYRKITDVHGIAVEFGVRWGRDLAMLEALRGIYEPFNYSRTIVGFDTFEGFPSVHKKDGASDVIARGSYGVTKDYEKYLSEVMDYHEKENPVSHIKKYELIKGDASREIKKYLHANPQTIIALAYFDFDVYTPTKDCLEAIKSHVTKGSIIGFDELNHRDFPGETLALQEVFGLGAHKITRNRFSSIQSYIVIE